MKMIKHSLTAAMLAALVIFIQKFSMAAWSFSFRNSTWLVGNFHSEIQHGCLVIFIQKFKMAAWSFSFRN
jgi:hypothetical protein